MFNEPIISDALHAACRQEFLESLLEMCSLQQSLYVIRFQKLPALTVLIRQFERERGQPERYLPPTPPPLRRYKRYKKKVQPKQGIGF